MNRLITVPVSHYCEKARWALDLAGVPYVEDGWPPAIHRMVLMSRHRAVTAPVLVLDDGRTLRGSTAIVRHADQQAGLNLFAPGVDELVERFDARLGVAARVMVYSVLLGDDAGFDLVLGTGLSPRRRRAMELGRPAIMAVIRKAFRVRASGIARATATCEEELAFAHQRRGDSPYLVGDRFTAADLTFAALAGPLVFPDGHPVAPRAHALPHEAREAVARWREKPGAEAILTLYSRHRVTAGRPSKTAVESQV